MHDVVHVLGTAQAAGAGIARVVVPLARHLDPNRFRLHAWFLDGHGPLADELEAAGARVRCLGGNAGVGHQRGLLRFACELFRVRPALVHFHVGGRSLRAVAKLSGALRVVHLHGYIVEHDGMAPVANGVGGAEAAIAVSRTVARHAGATRLVVIPTGVELPPHGERPASATVIVGAAARLVPAKGLIHLIRAAAELVRHQPELRFEIAGDGPERDALKCEIDRLGLEGRVELLGWRDDIAAQFQRWSVYVQPSLAEGLGLALLEAMAAGLPVVASAVGGMTELVTHESDGLLVPPADPSALAAALARLVDDLGLRARLGLVARASIEIGHNTARMVSAIDALYAQVLDARS